MTIKRISLLLTRCQRLAKEIEELETSSNSCQEASTSEAYIQKILSSNRKQIKTRKTELKENMNEIYELLKSV